MGSGADAVLVPAWLEGRGGRPEGYCHRVMLYAVRYVTHNGIKWQVIENRDRDVTFRRVSGGWSWRLGSPASRAAETPIDRQVACGAGAVVCVTPRRWR